MSFHKKETEKIELVARPRPGDRMGAVAHLDFVDQNGKQALPLRRVGFFDLFGQVDADSSPSHFDPDLSFPAANGEPLVQGAAVDNLSDGGVGGSHRLSGLPEPAEYTRVLVKDFKLHLRLGEVVVPGDGQICDVIPHRGVGVSDHLGSFVNVVILFFTPPDKTS